MLENDGFPRFVNKNTITGLLCVAGLLLECLMLYMYYIIERLPGIFDVAVLILFSYVIYKSIIRKQELNRWEFLLGLAASSSFIFTFVLRSFYVF